MPTRDIAGGGAEGGRGGRGIEPSAARRLGAGEGTRQLMLLERRIDALDLSVDAVMAFLDRELSFDGSVSRRAAHVGHGWTALGIGVGPGSYGVARAAVSRQTPRARSTRERGSSLRPSAFRLQPRPVKGLPTPAICPRRARA